MFYNGIDIPVDLEVLCFWDSKIRAIVRTKAMYKFTLVIGMTSVHSRGEAGCDTMC